jgi:hypothetical protein
LAELSRVGILPLLRVQVREIAQTSRDLGVLFAENSFPDRQAAQVKRLRIREFFLLCIKVSQNVQCSRDVGMLFAKCLFPDRQAALVKRFRQIILFLGRVQVPQVVQRTREIGMLLALRLFANIDTTLENCFLIGEFSLSIINIREVDEDDGDVGMLLTVELLPDRQTALIMRFRIGILRLLEFNKPQAVENPRRGLMVLPEHSQGQLQRFIELRRGFLELAGAVQFFGCGANSRELGAVLGERGSGQPWTGTKAEGDERDGPTHDYFSPDAACDFSIASGSMFGAFPCPGYGSRIAL